MNERIKGTEIRCKLLGHRSDDKVDWSFTYFGNESPLKRYICDRCKKAYWALGRIQIDDDDKRLAVR